MQQPLISISGNESAHSLAGYLSSSLGEAVESELEVSAVVRGMRGMSGQRYRVLINRLIARIPDARYLEVGSWMGSTLCAAIDGNSVDALAIDNWSEFGGPSFEFFKNVGSVDITRARVSVLHSDFRAVRWNMLGRHNVYLFDGPHSYQDQFDGLALAANALDDVFVFIVDDWNWREVRDGTRDAINANGLSTLYSIEVRSTSSDLHAAEEGLPKDELSDWHNGYFLSVLQKPRS